MIYASMRHDIPRTYCQVLRISPLPFILVIYLVSVASLIPTISHLNTPIHPLPLPFSLSLSVPFLLALRSPLIPKLCSE